MSVPKLRFKEFNGNWTGSKLGRLIGISSASRVFKEQWQESGVPFYRTSDVISIFKNKENEKAYISLELFEELAKKSGKIQEGDLLITGGGTIGIPYLIPNNEPLYFKDADLLWLKSSGVIDGSFFYNFFISPKFREYLKSISHTGTISHFTIEQAKETPFKFPSKPEQTKIATFFSAVDEKISQLTQKHALLSQYKQGMMQKLFSQQIRFKADDGSEFGEWEEKELKDVSNLTSSKRVHLADYVSKGIPFFRGKEITELKSGGVPSDMLYISPIQFNEFKEKFGAPKNGEILITAVGTLANTYLINTNYEFYFKDGNLIWLKDIKSNPNFLMILLDVHKNDVLASAIGSTQKALTIANLNKLIFKFPTLEEQTKIANFLSAIDQKIEKVAQQIKQAKQWKKGLLQQMFV